MLFPRFNLFTSGVDKSRKENKNDVAGTDGGEEVFAESYDADDATNTHHVGHFTCGLS